jgi:hypothetical protein
MTSSLCRQGEAGAEEEEDEAHQISVVTSLTEAPVIR